eukprot:gene57754-biopygen36472
MSWSCVPHDNTEFTDIHDACMAERNQQQYSKQMHDKVIGIMKHECVDELGKPAVPAYLVQRIFEARFQGEVKPVPGVIAQALLWTRLDWHREDGTTYLCVLSGAPQLTVALTGPWEGHIGRLLRIAKGTSEQPYAVLNKCMRECQNGEDHAKMTVSQANISNGEYVAVRSPVGQHVLLSAAKFSRASEISCEDSRGSVMSTSYITWDGGKWCTSAARLEYSKGESFLEDVLQSDRQRVKAYRGLSGVRLPKDVYSRNQCILWGAYTSVTADQGVATAFAAKKDPAIFTVWGHLCVDVALWSRFAGEAELMYAPNSKFLITDALSDEQAEILGKGGTQLFELESITECEALTIFIRRMAALGGEGVVREVILQMFEAVALLEAYKECELINVHGGDGTSKLNEVLCILCNPTRPALNVDDIQIKDSVQAAAIKVIEIGGDVRVAVRCFDAALHRARHTAAAILCNVCKIDKAEMYDRIVRAARIGDVASCATLAGLLHPLREGVASHPSLLEAAETLKSQKDYARMNASTDAVSLLQMAVAKRDCGATLVLYESLSPDVLRRTTTVHHAVLWYGLASTMTDAEDQGFGRQRGRRGSMRRGSVNPTTLASVDLVMPCMEVEVLERLVARGGIHARSVSGATPLHVAAMTGDWKATETLLAAGADARASDHTGDLPHVWARLHGHGHLSRTLFKAAQLAAQNERRRDVQFKAAAVTVANAGHGPVVGSVPSQAALLCRAMGRLLRSRHGVVWMSFFVTTVGGVSVLVWLFADRCD